MDIENLNEEMKLLFGFNLTDFGESYYELSKPDKIQALEIFSNLVSEAKKHIKLDNLPENHFITNKDEASHLLLSVIPENHLKELPIIM